MPSGSSKTYSIETQNQEAATLTLYHLIQIVRKNDDTDCVKQLRLVTMFLIGFSGFLRYQELANIRKGDIIFY